MQVRRHALGGWNNANACSKARHGHRWPLTQAASPPTLRMLTYGPLTNYIAVLAQGLIASEEDARTKQCHSNADVGRTRQGEPNMFQLVSDYSQPVSKHDMHIVERRCLQQNKRKLISSQQIYCAMASIGHSTKPHLNIAACCHCQDQ